METREEAQEMALIIAALPDKERPAMEAILNILTAGKTRKSPPGSKNSKETGR